MGHIILAAACDVLALSKPDKILRTLKRLLDGAVRQRPWPCRPTPWSFRCKNVSTNPRGITTSDGAEPGLDPTKSDGGQPLVVGLRQRCDIDVVDFSEDDLSLHYLDNDSLGDFLAEPRPEWGKVLLDQCQRPQLDVLRLLGNHKNLHPLAIESVLSPENRTKAEW
jgi:hypothetical protein